MSTHKKRLSIIQTEATSISPADFLLTHAPFEHLYLDNDESTTENGVLNDLLLGKNDSHQFIMVQGGNGSGKSHLIRWLKERYETLVSESEEAVLFISRSHNNLLDAITQLLNSRYFSDDIRESILKKIQNKRGEYTVEQFKQLINFNFKLLIEVDLDCTILEKRDKAQLAQYLLNPYILSEYLMCEGGPLDRIRARIETTESVGVADGDKPAFTEADFSISFSEIQAHLKNAESRADAHTIRLAERLCSATSGPDLQKKICKYLNAMVPDIIQKTMDLKAVNFQRIFEDLRKDLKKRGMGLSLFIEDINAFTGIDGSLLEALITDNSTIGNEDCCRLISVVGSTNRFFDENVKASVRQRITSNIYIREGSLLTEENLGVFTARYINAINLSDEQVAEWYENGANLQNIPLAQCPYEFSKVMVDGKPYSIFPFSESALKNLYSTLENIDDKDSRRTPRIFIQHVLQQILIKWYTLQEDFISDEKNFSSVSFHIPKWKNHAYEKQNSNWDAEYAIQRGLILRIWGNQTTELTDGCVGGVSEEIFDAFKVPYPDGGSIIAPPVLDPPPPLPPKPINFALKLLEEELSDWNAGKRKLASHEDLRGVLANLIINYFPWRDYGIPVWLYKAYISIKYICIEGQAAAITVDNCMVLSRDSETYSLLVAVANYKLAGENSWEFEFGFDYYTVLMAWLEKHAQQIIKMATGGRGLLSIDELTELGVAAQLYAKGLVDGIDVDLDDKDIAVYAFTKPVNFDLLSKRHTNAWVDICNGIRAIDIYNYSFSFFRMSVGGKRVEDANYIIADAEKLIRCISALRENGWTPNAKYDAATKYRDLVSNLPTVVKVFLTSANDALEEESLRVTKYENYFKSALSSNFKADNILKTLSAMKQFLTFLRDEMNLSYNEKDFETLRLDHQEEEMARMFRRLEDLRPREGFDLMFGLDSRLMDDLSVYYSLFAKFNRLLEEKTNIFRDGLNSEKSSIVKDFKEAAASDLNTFITITNQIGGAVS